uniref:guanylate cyclase n=1 Tax=Panagrolaimus superbus TaxID=310955 RepID=A0A914YCS2_9BILA
MFPRGISSLDATISYSRTAGGLTVAMNKILDAKIWQNINFTVIYYFDQCNEALAAGGAVKLIRDEKVDVIIGPACSASVAMAATVAAFYNFPIFAWSTVLAADLSDGTKYPTLASTSINSYTLSQALGDLFAYFQWNEFAFFYSIILNSASPRCSYYQADLDRYVSVNDITMVYKKQTTADSYVELRAALRRMKTQARIIVTCYESSSKKREFIAAAMDEGMTTNDYVFVYLQTAQNGFGTIPFWVDTSAKPDGRDEQIKKASKNIIILDLEQLPSTFKTFNTEVYNAMFEWPINCQESNDCPPVGANMTKQAAYLTDTFFLYASALNKTITQYPNDPDAVRNGKIINGNTAKTKFAGYSGQVRINENGTREPVYNVLGLDSNWNPQLYFVIERKDNETSNIIPQFKDEKTTLWGHRGGFRPLSHPVCDFDGSACPPSVLETYLGFIIGGIILGTVTILNHEKMRIENRRKMDELWQIPFVRLSKPSEKKQSHSPRSTISSLGSSSARLSASNKEATEHFDFYYFNNELLAAKKHNSRPKLTEKDNILFRKMQQTSHDNLCRFMGLSMDGPMYLSLWKYCSRGCLRDVIAHSNVTMDGFFMTSLISDIVEGISYLHNSPLFQYHGDISSKTCLVDERWQVKITLYGLYPFKVYEKRDHESLLWCAPEILRSDEEFYGNAAADIYSFAITASEIVTQKAVWAIGDNNELDSEEVVYRVKKITKTPFRPALSVDTFLDVNPSLLHLIRDCWSDEPKDRPTIKVIQTLLKSMQNGKSKNLMDHVFNSKIFYVFLEQYANNLEQEVEARTKELAEEKKKSDILLYRMLPRTVADKLKLGQSVEPESFDSVTIFFSDVVGFTVIASKCTPIQVVNFLNDLYSTFDTIIDEFNCYKVETIGDAYLVVSGIPIRNGNQHAVDIAEMSMGFLKAIKNFKIGHMPNEKVNIRIGLHTGPCVAGTVGLTMPRYCLFGDTVNTASRMESNGKPGKIHLSPSTNHYLTKLIGGYQSVSRGEIIIKGKGVMETYFLCTGDENKILE